MACAQCWGPTSFASDPPCAMWGQASFEIWQVNRSEFIRNLRRQACAVHSETKPFVLIVRPAMVGNAGGEKSIVGDPVIL